MLALSRRRFEEAAALLRDAIALDPYAAWLHARLAWTHHLAGDHTQSLRQIEAALEQFPGHEGTELYAGIILAFNGEAKRAVEIASALAQRRPYFDPAAGVHAYALAVAGQADVALSILERLEWMGRERYALDSFSPAVYVTLGEEDKALAGLAAANDARCPWFFQALADPRLRPLQPRAEFVAMQRILAEMEQQAHGD
jgi:tetratricopeptide (TPR) repeat protein